MPSTTEPTVVRVVKKSELVIAVDIVYGYLIRVEHSPNKELLVVHKPPQLHELQAIYDRGFEDGQRQS